MISPGLLLTLIAAACMGLSSLAYLTLRPDGCSLCILLGLSEIDMEEEG